MRNYLTGYINSLSYGQVVLAKRFIYEDRRILSDIPTGRRLDISKMHVQPGTQVTRNNFERIFSNAEESLVTLYEQANTSAKIRESLQLKVNNKLARIEAALKAAEIEIKNWEDDYSRNPSSVNTITRSFGELGMRPIESTDRSLIKLSTVMTANCDVVVAGDVIYTDAPDRIQEEFFSTEEGLQVRLVYNFVPGLTSRIRLAPISGLGDITISEIRIYGSTGQLVSTFAEDEELNRTLEYSIPKAIVSRVEVDLIDRTYQLVLGATVTGSQQTIIPARSAKFIYQDIECLIWRKIEAFNLPNELLERYTRIYDNGGASALVGHRVSPVIRQLNEALGGIFRSYDISSPGMVAWIDDLFRKRYGGKERTESYSIIEIPSQIINTEYSYRKKMYHYAIGLASLTCVNDLYSEIYRSVEDITFENGIPSRVTLKTDEFLPDGSYINFFISDGRGNLVPIIPYDREITTEILKFDEYMKAYLLFNPDGPVIFYRDAVEPITLASNGREVLGSSANFGILNTISGGNSMWAQYSPDISKSNTIPSKARVASYISKDGRLGETFSRIPDNLTITSEETPFIDIDRINEDGYNPVQVIIDGYKTSNLTKYDNTHEEEFPTTTEYSDGVQVIHYKVHGRTITFEKQVDRPVRVIYEYVLRKGKIIIEMGVIHGKAAAPVLYQYTISYT